ncbi:Dienelactone hydrolase family protein [Fodinibius roseus]|uniref:Dienelactone hydrolase family protein n=1 Tax=Fodinibius roseus TaxID=1194090 RepID=A0A1M5IQV5_9BACT|nr:dienelactone hydrolase family protein [Fodinibius roseus]SHG30595.1 Dienelactone hydrolase family protein [Fodinibius roseus]
MEKYKLTEHGIPWLLTLGMLLLMNYSDAVAQADRIDFFDEPYDVEYEEKMAESVNAGIDRFLTRYTSEVIGDREKYWNRQFDSPHAYNVSVDHNRNDLRRMIGATDTISDVTLEIKGDPGNGVIIADTEKSRIYEVEWTIHEGLKSEGLLLIPKGDIRASAVVIPDADETPEGYAGLEEGPGTALKMAEKGVRVLIPTIINRKTQHSGRDQLIPAHPWQNLDDYSVSRWSNITHREWIWRQSYVMGHHIIGMEVQKVLAAVDWLVKNKTGKSDEKIGVMGYAEGGLLAFYSAALDTRIDAAWVSGYFGSRKQLWREPVYRNVWGLLTEFGDAEMASLITPRSLLIEAAPVPGVKEPLPVKKGQRDFALAGELRTPSTNEIKSEIKKLNNFFPNESSLQPDVSLIDNVVGHGTDEALRVFIDHLGINAADSVPDKLLNSVTMHRPTDPGERHRRVFYNMEDYIQDMIPTADRRRYQFLEGDLSSPQSWDRSMEPYRKQFYDHLVGRIDKDLLPLNPRVRQIYDKENWKGYEVALDVWPDVNAWGILAVPKNINPDDKRPAIVMQHGIGGLPTTSIRVESYHHVLNALVNRGFVVFAPYNPYQFNIRKATALKKSVYSIIIPQHQQILNFLKSRDYVDRDRIALYGKSWGGRTALRVPVVLKDYSVVVSSAYFNDWLNKAVSTNYSNSYYWEDSIGIYEWNMGNTFTHAEMAAMIAPRPFMVEDGYLDGVAPYEMVASEFGKVERWYDMMGISERAELEIFKGGHEINGKGTFRFLHKYLNWPAPESPTKSQLISE